MLTFCVTTMGPTSAMGILMFPYQSSLSLFCITPSAYEGSTVTFTPLVHTGLWLSYFHIHQRRHSDSYRRGNEQPT